MTPEREKWFGDLFNIQVNEQLAAVAAGTADGFARDVGNLRPDEWETLRLTSPDQLASLLGLTRATVDTTDAASLHAYFRWKAFGESPAGYQRLPVELQQLIGAMAGEKGRDALLGTSRTQAWTQIEVAEIDRLIDAVRHGETVDELFTQVQALHGVDGTRPSLRATLVTAMAKRLGEVERNVRDDDMDDDRLQIVEDLLQSILSAETAVPPQYLAEPLAALAGTAGLLPEQSQLGYCKVILTATDKVPPDQRAPVFVAVASQIGVLAVGQRLLACRLVMRNISKIPEDQRAEVLVLVTKVVEYLFDDLAQFDTAAQVEVHAGVRDEIPNLPKDRRDPVLFELADTIESLPEADCTEAHAFVRRELWAIPADLRAPTVRKLIRRIPKLHPGEPRTRAHADLRALAPTLPKTEVGRTYRELAARVSKLLHDDQQAARIDLLTGIETILDAEDHANVLMDLSKRFASLPVNELGQPCRDILESTRNVRADLQTGVFGSLRPHLLQLSDQDFAACARSCPPKLWKNLRDDFPDRLATLLDLDQAEIEATMPARLYELCHQE